jgi:hypothetical protein
MHPFHEGVCCGLAGCVFRHVSSHPFRAAARRALMTDPLMRRDL